MTRIPTMTKPAMKQTLRHTTLLIAGSLIIMGQPAEAALKHYWPLDDTVGTTATSGVAGGNDGTVVGFDETKLNDPAESPPGDWVSDTPAQPAHSTGSLDFEGGIGTTYMDGGNIGIRTDENGGEATVSLWFKPRNMADDNRILVNSGAGGTVCCGPGLGGHIHTLSNGAIEIWKGDGWQPAADAGTVQDGQWHHLAFVWVGDQATTYVNGVEQNTVESNFNFDADNGIATNAPDPELGFGLGRSFNSQFGISDAIFDDVAVWDNALVETHIQLLASGTSPLVIPEPHSLVITSLACLCLTLARRGGKRSLSP